MSRALDKNTSAEIELHNWEGFFQGEYDITIDPYDKLDYSRLCFIFSGQGVWLLEELKSILIHTPNIDNIIEQADTFAKSQSLPNLSDSFKNSSKNIHPMIYNLGIFALKLLF